MEVGTARGVHFRFGSSKGGIGVLRRHHPLDKTELRKTFRAEP
jgi:hypothetical protein